MSFRDLKIIDIISNSINNLRKFRYVLSGTVIYELILIKIYINAKKMETQLFVLLSKIFSEEWPQGLLKATTLTFIIMDNFCPWFSKKVSLKSFYGKFPK